MHTHGAEEGASGDTQGITGGQGRLPGGRDSWADPQRITRRQLGVRGGCQTHEDPLTGLRRQRQDLPPVRWGSRRQGRKFLHLWQRHGKVMPMQHSGSTGSRWHHVEAHISSWNCSPNYCWKGAILKACKVSKQAQRPSALGVGLHRW